jgi:hypothetical protein
MLHYIVIKQADTPVHNCDIEVPLLYKALCFRPIPHSSLMSEVEMLPLLSIKTTPRNKQNT